MDKVQKIRAEIERRYRENKADGYSDVCEELWDILSFIDSLQEEPVSESINFEQELYKAFGQVKDFTLGVRIAKRFYDMGKKRRKPVSEDLKKAAEKYAFTMSGEDEVLKHDAFIEGAQWQKQKDSMPASEDLEEAGKEWLSPQLDKSYAAYGETKQMELTHFDGYAMLDAIEFGAQWQQAKNSIPAEYLEEAVNAYIGYAPEVDESSSTYGKRQAFKAGAEWQKQQDSMPISEDVVSVAKHYLYSNILYDDVYVGPPTDKDCIEMFKAGAQWQKQKDQSHLVHEHIDPPTFEEAQGEKKKED